MDKHDPDDAGFNRGLTEGFVDQLNELYDQGGWWRKFVEDPELFLAIRDNYVNVYYRGCSLVRLTSSPGGVVGEVNYKYLLLPKTDNSEYVKVVKGKPRIPDGLFVRSLDQLGDMKAAATRYAGPEKTGVHEIVRRNASVVDVEIAFGGQSNRRIDLVSVRSADGVAILTFYEAKHFNNSDLRAREDRSPDVLEQMRAYDELIDAHRHRIVKSYKTVLGNRLNLKGLAQQHTERHKTIEGLVDREIELDPMGVRLIVFGFDGDQRDGDYWRPHLERLKQHVSTTSIGDPTKLVLRF